MLDQNNRLAPSKSFNRLQDLLKQASDHLGHAATVADMNWKPLAGDREITEDERREVDIHIVQIEAIMENARRALHSAHYMVRYKHALAA